MSTYAHEGVQEGVGSLRARVTGNFELPDVGSRN